MVQIPIVGNISCGNGIMAYRDITGYEPTPADWVRGGEYFYHRAKGDSMINARIMDGDLVLIRKQDDVENGEIAAVLADDEIYLKRVFKNNGTLVLQSENPNYPPVICSNRTNGYIKIIGKLKKIIINA
jgi:repressor LexA